LNGETVIKRFSNSDFQLAIFEDEYFLDADLETKKLIPKGQACKTQNQNLIRLRRIKVKN
jgi:hypothetical protein